MWHMQVNLGTEEKPNWKSVSKEGSPPYEFDSEESAERMLEICYPDQVMEDRLDDKEVRVRVIKVEE